MTNFTGPGDGQIRQDIAGWISGPSAAVARADELRAGDAILITLTGEEPADTTLLTVEVERTEACQFVHRSGATVLGVGIWWSGERAHGHTPPPQ